MLRRSLPLHRLLVLLLALAAGATWARAPVIVVDPGHGGSQEGAAGPNGEREKRLALQISRRLAAELEATLGATVALTRRGDRDLSLSERVAFANERQPDLFISVHMNSMPTRRLRARIRGIETYFLSASASGVDAASTAQRENQEGPMQREAPGDDVLAFILADLQRTEAHADSSRLAYAVHQKVIEATGGNDRGVQQAPFYVLNGLDAPAILVEVGYISHPDECRKLKRRDYQEKLARGIAAGVKAFLDELETRDAPGGGGVTTAAP